MSTSSSVLKFIDEPSGEMQAMRVWHTNVEDPFTFRKSMVVVPSEPQARGADVEGCTEDVESIVSTLSLVQAKPKRRLRGNDSVSCIPNNPNIFDNSDIAPLG